MADETVDLIEETNDDVDNWMYYNVKDETYTETDSQEQLINIDSTDLVTNDNDQTLEYVCNDNGRSQELQDNIEHNNNETPLDNVDDLSKHNLIVKDTIDENGQVVEKYLCQQCNMPFNSVEDFLICHPCLEILSEQPDQLEQQQHDTSVAHDKLWDLVENLDETGDNNDVDSDEIIEMKPNVSHHIDTELHNEVSNNDLDLDTERYFCYDCKQVFTDLTTAQNHDCDNHIQHTEETVEPKQTLIADNTEHNSVYRCHLCGKDYLSLRSFNNHQYWHKKSVKLLGHTKTLHDIAVVCSVCNTKFASEKNLKLHMKMHKKQTIKTIQEALPAGAQKEYNDLNQFFCEICNKSFDQKLLVIHKNMHQNLEEYNCGKCNKQFENSPSYEIHMQMHIDNNANRKTTVNEGQEAPSTSSQGSNNVGGKRKHACQYCGKEFLRPYEKVKHERIHTGEKPYECEVCGKTFRVSYSLTLHLRTHTDIRPYVCETCNKPFKQHSVYVHHLKTHDSERSYRCDICLKSFRTSVQLSGHKNIHSKPYHCTDCNRPFASLYAVKKHMKTHNKCHKANKNLKNRCSICGASYARLFALRFHLKEQHNIDIDPTQLLADTSSNAGIHRDDIDPETVILMNAANEASNLPTHIINVTDVDNENEINVDNDDDNDGIFSNQIDHEENIQNPLTHNRYLDETETATQAILNTQGISIDNFNTEEIITGDW